MKLASTVVAVPSVCLLVGLSAICLGVFLRFTGDDLVLAARLRDFAGILVLIGGILGILFAIVGRIGGNRPMIFHGLIAAAEGPLIFAYVLFGPHKTRVSCY